MRIIQNPYRGSALPAEIANISPTVKVSSDYAQQLLAHCPFYEPTPLVNVAPAAQQLGLSNIIVKDERKRFGLGSFKALGAGFVVARDAFRVAGPNAGTDTLKNTVYVTASAGNHGLSLAAASSLFGAESVIYLSKAVPTQFQQRLTKFGARVVVEGDDYAQSMESATAAAEKNGWVLLSDSTWSGYDGGVDVMEGYLVLAREIVEQASEIPSHVFIQAGVGGIAAALSAYLRKEWGEAPVICVVEPQAAPALMDSILAARPVVTEGEVSSMGRLDCKEPSYAALKSLAYDADYFLTVSDDFTDKATANLSGFDLATSPSGGAGYAGLLSALENGQCKLTKDSSVLLVLTEGAV